MAIKRKSALGQILHSGSFRFLINTVNVAKSITNTNHYKAKIIVIKSYNNIFWLFRLTFVALEAVFPLLSLIDFNIHGLFHE